MGDENAKVVLPGSATVANTVADSDRLFEHFARREADRLRRRNLNRHARCGIATLAGVAFAPTESTESDQLHFTFFFQTLGDRVRDCVDGTFGSRFARA